MEQKKLADAQVVEISEAKALLVTKLEHEKLNVQKALVEQEGFKETIKSLEGEKATTESHITFLEKKIAKLEGNVDELKE